MSGKVSWDGPVIYVGLLHEEKILPLGKDITAVGICSSNRGIPEIKSCNSLPYFLSERTKDQMIAELAFKTKVLLWSWVVFGSLAIGILSYVAVRYWNRWKGRRPQRQTQRQNAVAQDATFEDTGDVVDRQLCVICLTRRRLAAFVPCGHVVCCQRCAFYVVRDLSPKCPCLKNGQYQWEERSICYYNSQTMSAPDQAAAVVLSQLVMAADGTVIGLALAFIAVRSVIKFKATNSALHQIKEAPYVRVSDLRSVVSEHGDSNQSDDGKLVIVRGTVEAKSVVANDVLVAHDSGEKDVIVQRSQTVLHLFLSLNFAFISIRTEHGRD
nr:E3 ubiquitin-protein ligase SPL2 [Ipomoea batatas]